METRLFLFAVLLLIGSGVKLSVGLPSDLSTELPGNNSLSSNSSLSHRNPKYFPFYTLGRFSQDVCVGTNSLTGTCMLGDQCDDLGGTSTGSSACSQANTRQASCCILTQTCGAQTNYNNTYFVNSGYPQVFGGGSRCNIQVTRSGSDICQLRIDFLDFSLAQPTGDGACSIDYFAVTGGSSPVPRICGENSGQHVYVDFSGNNPMTITMATSGSFTFNRRWHLHLQQIGCDSTSRAPIGCLQYWTDVSGVVRSFNYASSAPGTTNTIGVQGSRQIASQSYGACVRPAPGQCSITWSLAPNDIYAFTVTGDVGAIDPAILGTAAVQETNCVTDYVTIPAAIQNGVQAAGDRFCGLGIDTTTSNARPFVIYSVTNANENPDIVARRLLMIIALLIMSQQVGDRKKSRRNFWKAVWMIFLVILVGMKKVDAQPWYWADFYDDDYEEFDTGYDHHHYYDLPEYRGCGMKAHDNNTILFNPNFPQAFQGGSKCSYRIHRGSHKICQVRIDFLIFSLAQPTGDGVCTDDYFTVENGGTTIPRICGENQGQHIYVDFGTRLFPLTVVVATSASKHFNRRWQLRVTKIKCHSKYRAPTNCLQYNIEPNSYISSFNYGREENANFNSIGTTGSRQIASLDYTICFRKRLLDCQISYTRPTSDPFAFTLTDDVKGVDPVLLGTAAVSSQTCTTDFITIPAPYTITNAIRTNLASDQFCGLGFGQVYSQTFSLRVVTDANENPDIANRGFYLTYAQGAC